MVAQESLERATQHEDCNYARPNGRLIDFQPTQVSVIKIGGAYAKSWWWSKLCGLGAAIPKRLIKDGGSEVFVKSFE